MLCRNLKCSDFVVEWIIVLIFSPCFQLEMVVEEIPSFQDGMQLDDSSWKIRVIRIIGILNLKRNFINLSV